jgi:hypothetical protein
VRSKILFFIKHNHFLLQINNVDKNHPKLELG